jgi:hypothetical protein
MIIIGADYHPGFQQIAFVDTERRLQRWQTAVRTHQQTGELAPTFLAGGSGANRSSGRSELATEVFTSGDAARAQDREGGDGAETGRSFVLDVAQGMGLPATLKVRFARGTARKRPWCAVNHRLVD